MEEQRVLSHASDISSDDLKLFDLSPSELERHFHENPAPLNSFHQYLYGCVLAHNNFDKSLADFVESTFHPDVSLLLKVRLSLISPKYKFIAQSLWKKIQSTTFSSSILEAERLELTSQILQLLGRWEEAEQLLDDAILAFKQLGLARKALHCKYHLIDLKRKLEPESDVSSLWASLMIDANKLGDRSLYMSALSKLSFSL